MNGNDKAMAAVLAALAVLAVLALIAGLFIASGK